MSAVIFFYLFKYCRVLIIWHIWDHSTARLSKKKNQTFFKKHMYKMYRYKLNRQCKVLVVSNHGKVQFIQVIIIIIKWYNNKMNIKLHWTNITLRW